MASSTTLTIDFEEGQGKPLILLEPESSVKAGPFEFLIRQFPAVDMDVFVTKGTYSTAPGETLEVEDVLTFQDSDSAQLSRPPDGAISIQGFVFGPIDNLSQEINSSSVKLTTDPQTGTVKSSIKMFGAVKVKYSSSYKLISYRPETFSAPVLYGTTRPDLGVVVVRYKNAFEKYTFNVDPSEVEDGNVDLVTVYREKITTQDNGVFERPDGWPDNPSYPGYPEAELPDPDESHVGYEPVVEHYWVTNRGQLKWRDGKNKSSKPFQLSANYKGSFRVENNLSAFTGDKAKLLRNVDLNKLDADLKKKWGKGLYDE